MNILKKLDHLIITVFEKISHWVQFQTGVNCLQLSLALTALLIANECRYYVYGKMPLVCLVFGLPLGGLIHAYTLVTEAGNGKNGMRNSLEVDTTIFFYRLVIVCGCVIALVIWAVYPGFVMTRLSLLLAFLSAYLGSCTPLPPNQERLAKWLATLRPS